MDEYGLSEAGSPTEALLLFLEIYKLVEDVEVTLELKLLS